MNMYEVSRQVKVFSWKILYLTVTLLKRRFRIHSYNVLDMTNEKNILIARPVQSVTCDKYKKRGRRKNERIQKKTYTWYIFHEIHFLAAGIHGKMFITGRIDL